MSNRPFRFVHASDFHLEMPPQGLAEVPDHLREILIEAPYLAAERVFETVLAEEAELLVLAGDVLHAEQTGPRGPLFLAEQFHRLAQRQIPVYWAGGGIDPPDAWPSAVRLPENVHFFPRGRVEEFVHQHDDQPVVRITGASLDRQRTVRPSDFDPDPGGLFTIAVVRGSADPAALDARGIHYWALGGRHGRSTLLKSPRVAHFPGTCQGRQAEEDGAHGCTLVQVDEQRQARTSLIPTDVLRWFNEHIVVNQSTTRDDLETMFHQRMHALVESTSGMDLLIAWTVGGSGPLLKQLRRGPLATELLGWLRSEFGFGPPAAWSISLQPEPAAALPSEWYEQETIRGDFLRTIRQFQMNPDEPLELQHYVAEEHLAGTLGAVAAIDDKAIREQTLHQAALLGVDLLTGEEVQA